MVFDLDPSTGDFEPVRETAAALHEMLESAKVPCFLKTSGSRGLHIVVPLKADAGYGEVHAAAHHVATLLVAGSPKTRTLEFLKSNRHGRVFIDVNRNAYAQTYAAAFGVRARARAPVSFPSDWSELREKDFRPDGVTIATVFERLDEDPWAGLTRRAVSCETIRRRLGG